HCGPRDVARFGAFSPSLARVGAQDSLFGELLSEAPKGFAVAHFLAKLLELALDAEELADEAADPRRAREQRFTHLLRAHPFSEAAPVPMELGVSLRRTLTEEALELGV